MTDFDELYEWFQKDIMKPAVIRNGDTVETIIRIPFDDDFDFIYYQDNYNGQPLTMTEISYRGIYNKLNGQLYDLHQPLKRHLDDINSGKMLIDLLQDFEKDVRERIEEVVDANIDSLESKPFSDDRYLSRLADFRKNYAYSSARKMFLNNELCEELRYRCGFYSERKDTLSMTKYLKYPSESVEEAVTDYWINKKDDILLELRKNEIIREKLREIEANTDNPLHKQRAIINALKDSGAKNVTVTVEKDGQRCSFKYSADRLFRYSDSNYGTWEMSPKDREVFESCFGRHSSFHPEDIAEITYRGKPLYEADVPDCSEDEDVYDDESEDSEEGFTMSM